MDPPEVLLREGPSRNVLPMVVSVQVACWAEKGAKVRSTPRLALSMRRLFNTLRRQGAPPGCDVTCSQSHREGLEARIVRHGAELLLSGVRERR